MPNHITGNSVIQNRLRRNRQRRKFFLRLTPLIDVFIILLVFLLKNFSATPAVSLLAKDFHLPVSAATKYPEVAATLTVTQQAILMNAEFVDTTENTGSQKDLLNTRLYERLIKNKQKTLLISQHNPDIHFQGKVIIQADKRVPYKVIKRVIYTCGQAAFGKISLHVLKKET